MKKFGILRYLSAVTLIAFLLSATLPFFASYNISSSNLDTSLFGDKILICTVDGFKWVNLEDLQNDDLPKAHPDYECALCVVASNDSKDYAPSKVSNFAYHINYKSIKYYSVSSYQEQQLYLSSNHSRAPPTIIS